MKFSERNISWRLVSVQEILGTKYFLKLVFDKKQSVSQMIDLVVTIKTHTESSKSELSSGSFGHVKVLLFFMFFAEKREVLKEISTWSPD